MKIAITGASGLVGKELGKALAKAGHEIVVLARPSSVAKATSLPFPCTALAWDAERDAELPGELWDRQIDVLVHLAGESIAGKRWNARWKEKLWDSRVAGAQAIARSISNLEPSKRPQAVVTASAIGIYGDAGESSLEESSEPGADFLAKLCHAWESELEKGLPESVRFAGVRIGLVLSEKGGLLEKLSPIFRAGIGGNLGNGKQWMSWVHLTDLVNLFQRIIEDGSCRGVFNGVSPNPVRNSEFTKALAKSLNRSAPFPVPYLALRMASGEFAKYIMASQRVYPRRAEAIGFEFQYPDIESAFQQIFFEKEGDLVFITEQWVPKSKEEIFPFFANEKNLEEITPPWLNFRVLTKSTEQISTGTEITYSLRMHGIPIKWRTKILDWTPTDQFVDNQESGPYKKWHHRHLFEPLGNGTLMRDYVRYKLPLGRIGEIVAGALVRKDVHSIFNYRQKIIAKMFSS